VAVFKCSDLAGHVYFTYVKQKNTYYRIYSYILYVAFQFCFVELVAYTVFNS